MPMPKPTEGQTRDEWVSYCMSNSVMQEEFPNQEQRVAVCLDIWREENKNMSETLLKAIRDRGDKQTKFGYGILTADRWVANMRDAAGLEQCYHYASVGQTSFDDVMKKAANTLTYSNEDMITEDVYSQVPSDLELPKNTLMVFKHVLTTPRVDRDMDILRTEGADVDPKMLLLWQHVHTLPIGKMLKVAEHTKDVLRLYSCIVDMNDLSHDAAVMIDNKMGRFSHGFNPYKWLPRVDEKGEEIGGFDITNFEIMEESLVSVPSNVDAEEEEVLLSLVDNGKLTSGLMKEVGNTIREHRPVTVPGAIVVRKENEDEKGEEDENEPGTGSEKTGGDREGGEDTSPEETRSEDDCETKEETSYEEVKNEVSVVIDVMPENVEAPFEVKSGRSLSAKTLSVLKECQADLKELVDKGYEMSRGGKAICERCLDRLSSVIDSSDPPEEEEEKEVAEEITVTQAMAVVASEADRNQRDKLEYILRGIREAEDKRKRAEQFRRFCGR